MDVLRSTIVFFSITIIILLSFASANTHYLIDQKNVELKSIQLRKDDLINEQQRLEKLVFNLNQTIELQIQKQKELELLIASKSSNDPALQKLIQQAQDAINQQTSPTAPIQTTSTPPPVTRAS